MPEHKTRRIHMAGAFAVSLIILLSQSGYLPLRAGEPIRVGSTVFGTDGAVILWPAASLPIAYHVDGGPLGLDSNAVTTARVDSLFAVWQAVPTSTIAFTNAGSIASVTGCTAPATDFTDGDVDTFGEFLCVGFTGNPVIYDNTGVITDNLFGVGNSTLGFAGPTFSTAGGGTIISARAVLNGKFRDGVAPDSSDTEFEATILHELGHYIGLGHSQININCLSFVSCANFSDDTFGLPTMFPIAISGLLESPGVAPERTLSMDDIAWVSFYYPTATFATTHGTISGTVFFSDGVTHLQGVNVIARSTVLPRRNAVSGVSGYLYTGNRGLGSGFLDQSNGAPLNPGSSGGARNPALRGTYDIPVPSGVSYNISVEAVDPSFVGGSSVGPLGRQAGETFGLPGAAPAPLPGIGPIVAGSTSGGNNFTFPSTPATKDAFDAVASNDTPATATPITNGTISASISPFGNVSASAPDVDVYSFTALPNATVTLEIFARRLVAPPIPSTLDSVIEIVDASGTRLSLCNTAASSFAGLFTDPCVNDDITPSVVLDSKLSFKSATGVTAFLRVLDVRGDARPDMIYDLTVSGAGQAPPPAGCTSDFDGGGGGNDWNTAANWNPDGVPTGTSKVCIGAAFSVDHGGTDTISSLANVAGILNITGGTLTVTSSVAIGGTLNILGGTLNAPASSITSLTINSGALNFTGPTASVLDLTFNGGTLSASSGTVTLPAAGYTHAGGTLRLNGGSVTTAGTITQTGGLIQGGTPGTLTANVVQNGGTIGPGLSPGTLNLTGNFTQAVGGTVQIELGGTTAGTGYDQFNVSGTAVANGTFNVVLFGGFTPSLGNTFTIASAAGGGSGSTTINFPTLPAGLAWSDVSTANAIIIQVITASGCTINFDNSAGTGLWQTATNWDTNVLPVPADRVCIGAGFTVTKSAAGGDSISSLTVDNAAGVFTLSSNLDIAAASSIGAGGFTLSGGALQGAGTLTINGPANWTSGSMAGAGITAIPNTATLTINAPGTIFLDTRTLNNAGTVLVTTAPDFRIGNNATINNQAGGTFDFQAAGTALNNSLGNNVGTFNNLNLGTLKKSAGGGTSSFAGIPVNNTGAVVGPGLSPGTLSITGNYIQGAGGALNVELGSAVSFDVLAITGTATLNGTLNVLSFGGFAPGAGVSFQVMTFASGSGDFATKNGLNIATPPLVGLRQTTGYLLSNTLDADMSVTKTDSPDPVTATQNVTYTITVSNAGPGPGTSAVLNDVLPASTTFVSLPAVAGWTCTTPAVGATGTVNCTNPSVPAGANDVFTLVVATTGASVPSISNTATVSATQNDPTPANNSATASTTVNGVADLAVTKADSPDPVRAGNNLTYTVTVTNNGPNNATNVVLTDTLPANSTFVSATPSQGTCPAPVGGVLTCNLGTTNNGANATVTIVVTPQAAAVPAISGTASVTATESDSNLADNSATQPTTVQPQADLAVTKTDAPDPVRVGSNLTYTVTVSNGGPSAATNVVLTDTLPANVTFVSATAPCTQAAGTVTCNLGTVNNGANSVVTIVVTPQVAAVPSINNVASVGATEFDPIAANNAASQITTVNPVADLAVTKTDAPDPVAVGSNLTYTVTVTNNGPNNATGVTLADTLPANVTFVSATAPCTQAAGVVTCNLGTINNGANTVITIVVTPQAAAVPSITNSASATAAEFDSNAANSTNITQATAVTAVADVAITATDAPDPVNAGGNITYSITVTNNGPNSATNIVATTTPPAGLTFVSATASQGTCAFAAGTLTCNVGTLASAATATASVVVNAGAAAVPGVTLTANVTATQSDPNAANNSVSVSTTVNAAADLAVTKSDSPDPVVAGNNLTYNITVVNNGPSPSTAVVMTDPLPGTVVFVSSNPSQGTCSQAAGTVTCALGTINSGANATVAIVVTAPNTPGNLSNTASVTSGVTDPSAANNSATQATTVNSATVADFSLSAAPPVQAVVAGLSTGYFVTVTPTNGFTGNVALACSVNAPLATCSLSPATVSITGTTAVTATVTISTAARGTMIPRGAPRPPAPIDFRLLLPWLSLLLAFAFWTWSRKALRQRVWVVRGLPILFIVMLSVFAYGCAQNIGPPGTASGTYGVTITATSGSLTHNTSATLVVR